MLGSRRQRVIANREPRRTALHLPSTTATLSCKLFPPLATGTEIFDHAVVCVLRRLSRRFMLTSRRAEDLRRVSDAINNPFEEKQPHLRDYTAAQIARLQSLLEKQLGPEYISTRPGAGGGKVAYLAAEKAISLANEVFGFNGWSSEIRSSQIDFVSCYDRISPFMLTATQVDESQSSGRVSLGLSTIVRVTLKDGTFHEVDCPL
jgi:hypothetical protein